MCSSTDTFFFRTQERYPVNRKRNTYCNFLTKISRYEPRHRHYQSPGSLGYPLNPPRYNWHLNCAFGLVCTWYSSSMTCLIGLVPLRNASPLIQHIIRKRRRIRNQRSTNFNQRLHYYVTLLYIPKNFHCFTLMKALSFHLKLYCSYCNSDSSQVSELLLYSQQSVH
jgi:hypothetical protein